MLLTAGVLGLVTAVRLLTAVSRARREPTARPATEDERQARIAALRRKPYLTPVERTELRYLDPPHIDPRDVDPGDTEDGPPDNFGPYS